MPRRPPRYHPDAVTLRPDADDRLLSRIDATAGATVKDSFATLDLTGHGFQVLFEAAWIHRAPSAHRPPGAGRGPGDAVTATEVGTPPELATWAAAHGGGDVFRPALLTDPAVTVLAVRDSAGTLLGGAVVSRGTEVAGLSNVFTTVGPPDRVWRAVLAHLPGVPLVGYESGDDLAAAERAGFRPIGPLRVWLRS
ncbi:hypothetical protein GCM10027605_43850 [Micromonospora zhanjiangensis]